jgi:hypothetical protein
MRTRVILSSLIAVSSASLAAGGEDSNMPFRLRNGSDIIVSAGIAGSGPLRFLIDTGSSRSAIAERIADEWSLPHVGRTTVVTPAGRVTRPLVATTIAFAETRVSAVVMALSAVDLDKEIDGVIGSDLLSTRPFTIDYIGQRVHFDQRAQAESGASVLLGHGVGGFVVTVARKDGAPMRLIPDTGTATLVLFAHQGRPLPAMTPLGALPGRSVGGLSVGRAALLDELMIGELGMRNQIAVVLTASPDSERFADGLLPLHLFARVTFDAPAGRLTIVPRR